MPINNEYGKYLKQEICQAMPGNFTAIDKTLCLLIDPENRSFAEQDIGYPEFDLDMLDLHWQADMRK